MSVFLNKLITVALNLLYQILWRTVYGQWTGSVKHSQLMNHPFINQMMNSLNFNQDKCNFDNMSQFFPHSVTYKPENNEITTFWKYSQLMNHPYTMISIFKCNYSLLFSGIVSLWSSTLHKSSRSSYMTVGVIAASVKSVLNRWQNFKLIWLQISRKIPNLTESSTSGWCQHRPVTCHVMRDEVAFFHSCIAADCCFLKPQFIFLLCFQFSFQVSWW